MATTTERFPVDRLYIWSGLMAVIGLSTLLSSAASILAGSGSIGNWMMVIGGGALVFVVGWEVRHRNPAEFSKSTYWFVVLAFAALLSLVGSLMTVFSFL
jgi:fatty acid desaturase